MADQKKQTGSDPLDWIGGNTEKKGNPEAVAAAATGIAVELTELRDALTSVRADMSTNRAGLDHRLASLEELAGKLDQRLLAVESAVASAVKAASDASSSAKAAADKADKAEKAAEKAAAASTEGDPLEALEHRVRDLSSHLNLRIAELDNLVKRIARESGKGFFGRVFGD